MAAFFKFSGNKHEQVGDTIKKTNAQTKDMQMWHIVSWQANSTTQNNDS